MKFQNVRTAENICRKYEEMQKLLKKYPKAQVNLTAYIALYQAAKEYLAKHKKEAKK